MTNEIQNGTAQIVKIGTVAAQNIVKRLGLAASAVDTVEKAIADEINAMSAHFTLAVSDLQTSFEAETLKLKAKFEADLADVKAAWNYVRGKPWIVAAALGVALVIGVVVGLAL